MPEKPPYIPERNRPTLTLDIEKYQRMLSASDATEADTKELLDAIWLLVVSFIEAGFEVHSAENCGEHTQDVVATHSDKGVMLNSFQSQAIKTFRAAANAERCSKEAS